MEPVIHEPYKDVKLAVGRLVESAAAFRVRDPLGIIQQRRKNSPMDQDALYTTISGKWTSEKALK